MSALTDELEIALRALAAEVQAIGAELTPAWKARATEIGDAVVRIGGKVVTGEMSVENGRANLGKLTDALASDLLAAAYEVQAKRVELAGRFLNVLLNIAATAVA